MEFYKFVLFLVVSMKSVSCFWWRSPPAATTEQPTVRQMPIGYFRTYSYQPLNYGGFGYNWPNVYNNEFGYPLVNQELVKPTEETTSTTTTTTTTTPPPTTTTTTTTTEKPTTTSAPFLQQSPPVNQYVPFNRVQQQIPTYFRNSQQLQQDFQAYMQYLAFTQMSQSQRGQIQFVPCMCPVSPVGNGQSRPTFPNELLENRENDDEGNDGALVDDNKNHSETPQPIEEIEASSSTSQKEAGPIQENVV